MEKYQEALDNIIKSEYMKDKRYDCECAACQAGTMEKLAKSLKSLRHECLCPKESFVPYGVEGRLEPPKLYKKTCCVRGEDANCEGAFKCKVHPCVCKNYHADKKAGEVSQHQCADCGFERLNLCEHFNTDTVRVAVSEYHPTKRENGRWANEELHTVRMTSRELIDKIRKFCPCYFSHYWELKHDAAVELASIHRMLEQNNDLNGYVDILMKADFASTYNIPSADSKVCAKPNTMQAEIIFVQHSRREVHIAAHTVSGKFIPAHTKVIWTNDVWNCFSPSEGKKGANACNHNHALGKWTKTFVIY